MKIFGVQFDYGESNDYDRLAAVFAKSVELNCPAAELTIARIDAPTEVKSAKGMTSNHSKFKVWERFVSEQSDGEHVVLMDVDMMVLGDLRPAFKLANFDIGLTRRTTTKWPYNGGVIFVRVNQKSKAFIQTWGQIDDQMYREPAMHDPYKLVYKGQNQASLGWMVEHNTETAIVEFPCVKWNACNEDWATLNLAETVAVHIKSNLRWACLGKTGRPSKLRHVVNAWRAIAAKVDE